MINNVIDWLDEISANWWFLLVILVIAFLDSVIPIVPTETAVIIGGIAAGQGNQNIVLVILAGARGASLGDNTAYLLGRRFEPWVTRRVGDKGRKRLVWAKEQI